MQLRRETYFWKPRGDARVVASEAGRVTLEVVLASYGDDAPAWGLDAFNEIPFVCLQCIVGYWKDAKYAVAIGSPRATPALVAAVEGHPYAGELDELAELASPLRRPGDDEWLAFSEAAERIVVESGFAHRAVTRQVLRFRVVDPGWVGHMAPLCDWCLG